MLGASRVFVDVDTQFDFMSPSGSLYVPRAIEIIDNLRRLTGYARSRSIPIIASACAHREGDAEFQVFPPHCVRGTPGQRRIPETDHGGAPVIGVASDPDAASKFELAGVVVLEKEVYDFFSNPNADRVIAATPGAGFVVYGVATDYCVKAAVLGLCDRGRRVTVVRDAIRPVDARRGELAIEEFGRRGIRFATTDEICSR
jgi:nicotinamidase/pyrazinamidase